MAGGRAVLSGVLRQTKSFSLRHVQWLVTSLSQAVVKVVDRITDSGEQSCLSVIPRGVMPTPAKHRSLVFAVTRFRVNVSCSRKEEM